MGSPNITPRPSIEMETTPAIITIIDDNSSGKLQETSTDTKIKDVSKKRFECSACFKKVYDLFSKVFTWIQKLPGKIADVIDRWITTDDDSDSESEISEEFPTYTIHILPKRISVPTSEEEISEFKNNRDSLSEAESSSEETISEISTIPTVVPNVSLSTASPKATELYLNAWLLYVAVLKDSISRLSVNSKSDKFKLIEIAVIIKNFPNITSTPTHQEKLKTLETEIENLQAQICEKLGDSIQDSTNKARVIQMPALVTKQDIHQASISNLQRPSSFYNTENKCWLHSSFELFFAMGEDFFALIDAKALELPTMQMQYATDLTAYQAAHATYLNDCAIYNQNKDAYKAYKSAKKSWDAKVKSYTQDREKYDAAKVERKSWEANGRIGDEPIIPKRPKKAGTEPVKVLEPKAPKTPFNPKNDALLIQALVQYKEAVQYGDTTSIRYAVNIIYELMSYRFNDFKTKGKQQDSAAFIQEVLSCLTNSLFNTQKNIRGKAGGKNAGYEKTYENLDPHLMMRLNFPSKVYKSLDFQQLVNDEFSPKIIDASSSKILLRNQETGKNKNSISDLEERNLITNVPDYFVVHAARFGSVTWGTTQKFNTSLVIPENEIINFGIAFGETDDQNSDYDYQVCGVVMHSGETIESGHYTAEVKCINASNQKEQWFHCNDQGEQVNKTSSKTAHTHMKHGYVYLFRKVKK